MEKREQDILKDIKEKTENIHVPESLEPAQIEKLLEKKDSGKGKKANRRLYQIGVLAAACLVLIVGIGVWRGNASRVSEDTTESAQDRKEEAGGRQEGKDEDYEEIYAYIKDSIEEETGGTKFFGELGFAESSSRGMQKESSVEDSVSSTSSAQDSAVNTGAKYSTTNTRQEGVDEADSVKTDGRYLYALKENGRQISIIDTKGSLEEVGKIKAEKNCRISEFYLLPEEKKLIYIGEVYETDETGQEIEESTDEAESVNEPEIMYLDDVAYNGKSKVKAVTCDVKNPKEPEEIGSVTQSGSYSSSRFSGGYLYLLSSYNIGENIIKDEPKTFVPMAGGSLIAEDDIYLPPFESGCMYEVITAINPDKPSEIMDSKAIFTDGGELYVSNENIYYYETKWDDNGKNDKTVIRKIGYKDGKLSKAVKGTIKGYVEDSFSIDEYKGNLRIVAIVGDTNSVYVLDKKLKLIGSIKGLAKDERIYSARFMGDTGYFVTFRETDPLFSVDLSEPKNPKILGKLKIPGFSEYLHFYGKNKLLGIGMDVEEDTQITNGVKLTMFDISDKTDVKEENTLVLKNVYSTDVFYEYKAALVDVGKNMIGFAGDTGGEQYYYLFSYNKKEGFQCKLSEEINGNAMMSARGIYIDKVLYVVQGNVIEAYSLEDYKKVDDIIL